MSQQHFTIISGSPRPSDQSTSAFLSLFADERLTAQGTSVKRIDARKSLKGDIQEEFAELSTADALLFIFPLYFFCVPGLLMQYLQDYASYRAQHPGNAAQRVYAVVNCGFPEPEINTEAVRVIESFSRCINASFGFGVMLSCGGMLMGAKDAPFMKPVMAGLDDAFTRMAIGAEGDNIALAPKFPRRLYFMAGNMGWGHMARKNGLKKKDLYRKPYAL